MVEYARPDSDVSKGNWDDPNGNNNDILYDDVDEVTPSDTDYIQSGTDPSNDTCELGLSTVVDPEVSVDHYVRYRYRKQMSGGGQPGVIDITVRLLQGAVQIASWTHNAVTETWTPAVQTLSGAQADNISDYSNLRIEVTANKSSGARTSWGECSWAEFECPTLVITYKLEGITKDKNGTALGSCLCFLCKDNQDTTCSYIAYVLSNSVTGAYLFSGIADNDAQYFVISWKDGSPNVFDVTDHVLQPVVE